MMRFRIRKGLDVPIQGAPEQAIADGKDAGSVALLGQDYVGMRPALLVEEGDRVRLGQTLFTDRKHPEIRFTSPGSGVVVAVVRGERRSLRSIVIERSGEEAERFAAYADDALPALTRGQVVENLLASGLWTALRGRPYGRVPDPRSEPRSLFVTAIDSNPLAARPDVVIGAQREDFARGLTVISHLTAGPVFLCRAPGAEIPEGDPDRVLVAEFAGPHPAGLVGTHIHFLDPAGAGDPVWHIGYQDVIAAGKLFATGRPSVERVVALAGPLVARPRLVRTRLGARITDLLRGELSDGEPRAVSGSVLSGHRAAAAMDYLGRYHTEVSVIAEAGAASKAGGESYSASGLRARLFRSRRYALTTALHGRPAAMVPIGSFERVMPLDILPTQLLRALVVGDADMARALGCLELEEEDLALCSFVCPSKYDYGPLLRSMLGALEKEG